MSPVLLLGLLLVAPALPDQPRAGSSEGTVASLDLMDVDVMFVGAHPDDDTGVMGTFARYLLDEGWRGTVVTLTGGEGGGNATGPEAGPALGLIRREEERRALAMVGVDSPRFVGLTDFYFTLSAEETRSRWGQAFLCEVTREVRLRRPEVIVTMWPGPGTHGQHQMAARAATLAYARAGDAAFCPEQVRSEGLKPFSPAKLYYYDRPTADATLEVRTDDLSPRLRLRYADLKSLAVMQYRSQGYDVFQNVPSKESRPESFLRVASRVPVAEHETHLLEGALVPAGTSPAGVGLEVRPAAYDMTTGLGTPVEVVLRNGSRQTLRAARLTLEAPEGWRVDGAPAERDLAPGEEVRATFTVTAAASPGPASLVARYAASGVTGANRATVRAAGPVTARFVPLWDVAGYRGFAQETGTEWVIATLPTRIPAVVGRATLVAVEIANHGGERARGELVWELPAGVRLAAPVPYDLAAGATARVTAALHVAPEVLTGGRHAARIPVKVGARAAEDPAEIYALPAATAARVARAPAIDGDLSDMPPAVSTIAPVDRWWRKAPEGAADLSADVHLAWDDAALYVGVRVRDELVACNIAPDDVKSQLRSDAVGITVDPGGASRDTSTTLQFAAFPCTTAGWGARGFRDADAKPGLIEQTAAGARVASKRTDDGYAIEVVLPWSAMPSVPKPGAEIGLNVVLYDGDTKDARAGANISESGLAWAAFDWGGKQALPYVWPRVLLAR